MAEAGVFVVATTRTDTQRAMEVATVLAAGRCSELRVIVAENEEPSHADATGHWTRTATHDLDSPDPPVSVRAVSEQTHRLPFEPEIVRTGGFTACQVAAAVPVDATVVICGTLHWIIESRAQRLARELSKRNIRVIFLTSPEQPRFRFDPAAETELMRRLIC